MSNVSKTPNTTKLERSNSTKMNQPWKPNVMLNNSSKIGIRSVYKLENSELVPMQRSTSLGSSLHNSNPFNNNKSNKVEQTVSLKAKDNFCDPTDRNLFKNSVGPIAQSIIKKEDQPPQNYHVNKQNCLSKNSTATSPIYTTLRPTELCLNDEDQFVNHSFKSNGKKYKRPMSIIEEEDRTNNYLNNIKNLKTENPITIGQGVFSPYSPIATETNIINFMSRQAPDGCDSCVSNDVDPKKELSDDLLSFDSLKVEASLENICEKLECEEKEFNPNLVLNNVNDFYRITFEDSESKKTEDPKDLVFRKDSCTPLNFYNHNSPIINNNKHFSSQYENQIIQVSENYKKSPCYSSSGANYNKHNKNRYSKSIDNIFSESSPYLNQFDNRIKQEINKRMPLYPETPSNRDEMLMASASTSEEDMLLQKMPELECSYTLPRKKVSPKHNIPRTMS